MVTSLMVVTSSAEGCWDWDLGSLRWHCLRELLTPPVLQSIFSVNSRYCADLFYGERADRFYLFAVSSVSSFACLVLEPRNHGEAGIFANRQLSAIADQIVYSV